MTTEVTISLAQIDCRIADPETNFAQAAMQVAEAARHEDDWTSDAPSDGLQLPPRTAIARRLVEEWLERAADPA